jgi:hypothetical protein
MRTSELSEQLARWLAWKRRSAAFLTAGRSVSLS